MVQSTHCASETTTSLPAGGSMSHFGRLYLSPTAYCLTVSQNEDSCSQWSPQPPQTHTSFGGPTHGCTIHKIERVLHRSISFLQITAWRRLSTTSQAAKAYLEMLHYQRRRLICRSISSNRYHHLSMLRTVLKYAPFDAQLRTPHFWYSPRTFDATHGKATSMCKQNDIQIA